MIDDFFFKKQRSFNKQKDTEWLMYRTDLMKEFYTVLLDNTIQTSATQHSAVKQNYEERAQPSQLSEQIWKSSLYTNSPVSYFHHQLLIYWRLPERARLSKKSETLVLS